MKDSFKEKMVIDYITITKFEVEDTENMSAGNCLTNNGEDFSDYLAHLADS